MLKQHRSTKLQFRGGYSHQPLDLSSTANQSEIKKILSILTGIFPRIIEAVNTYMIMQNLLE